MAAASRLTELLNHLGGGGPAEDPELLDELYSELHLLAERHMSRQGPHHTLQPTALVHEAWLRIANGGPLSFTKREQFFALAGRVMRSVLVDHARARRAAKRGGARRRVTLAGQPGLVGDRELDLLDLEEVLVRLEEMDAELARLVDLRFFAGLDHPTIARQLGKSQRSVERGWRLARAWIRSQLVR